MDGEGARRVGGRCNEVGVAAVYTAAHLSLAVLEVLVHLDRTEIPTDYVAMGLEIRVGEIPHITPEDARAISSRKKAPAVSVPSVIVPRESNYVLYPEAPGFAADVLFIEPFGFDARLFPLTRNV